MTDIEKAAGQCIKALLGDDGTHKATKYINEKMVVKATRRRFKNRIAKGLMQIHVTIGKPNFLEREFIKKARKTGESFPIRQLQLKKARGR